MRDDTDIPKRRVVDLVCGEFEYFSLKFTKILMQLCKNLLYNFKKLRLIPSFSKAVYACATLFLKSASFALVRDFELSVKMMISRVVSSILNDFTC